MAKKIDSAAPAETPSPAQPAPSGLSRSRKPPVDLGHAIIEAFQTNERINQLLLESLDKKAWRKATALTPEAGGRTIAAIAAHMHNVRHMWLVVADPEGIAPEKLERSKVTITQAKRGLKKSAKAMVDLLETSLAHGGHVRDFRPDVVGFLCYAISHEAHHRGQIALLARQLGFPVRKETGYAMWDWNARWKEATGKG